MRNGSKNATLKRSAILLFRVNSKLWINVKDRKLYEIEIERTHNCGDEAWQVLITTENEECYSSDSFPTFDDAENYVKELIDAIN